MKKVKICFIRHGQTDENLNGRVQGRKDFPLNENGKEQAHILAKALKIRGDSFDCIYSSPLERAYDTASIIKSDLNLNIPIIKDDAFIERDFGIYEGVKVSYDTFVPILKDIGEGLETSIAIKKRVKDGLISIISNTDFKSILIVAHSHTIKALLNLIDENISFYSSMVNCAINDFLYEDGKFKIINYNIDPKKIANL